MIFVAGILFAQQNIAQVNTVKGFTYSYFHLPVRSFPPVVAKKLVSPNFYVNNLGFFCKQELKLQSFTRIPVKFRLGTVQQCDWMEGKKNSGLVRPN